MIKRITACLILGVWACAPPAADDPVATVGGRPIWAVDLTRAARAMFGDGVELAQVQKEAVLDALVATQLLTVEGLARGLDQTPRVRRQLGELERSLLQDQFYQRQVWAGVVASEEEVRALYEEWGSGQQVRLAHILCPEEGEARQVLEALAAGQSFALLARQHSRHLDSAPAGGDMGYMRRQAVLPAVAAAVWDAPVGRLHPQPIRTPLGYHVVEVRDRRRLSLEQQRVGLQRHVERLEKAAREEEALAVLRDKYQLTWEPRIAALMAQRRELSGEQVLFRWQGGQLSAADYLRRAPASQPVFRDTSRIKDLARRLAMEELIKLEASALGYDRLEEVRQPLARKLEELMGHMLFERGAAEQAPKPQQVRQFYAANRDQYRDQPRLTIREILVANQALADSLYALVRAGAPMDELARRFTVRTDLKATGGLWAQVQPGDPRAAKIYRLAMEGEGLLDPIKVAGGYSVVQVLDKAPGHLLEFEQVTEAVRRDLATVAMDAFIAELRRRYAAQIDIASGWENLI